MLRSFLSALFVLICLVLIETVILANIAGLPAIPDLMLIALMYIALNNGTLIGETTGFISGLLLDCLSMAPLGLNCLVRTIAGFVCGLFNRTLNMKGIFFIPALLGFCITIFKALLVNLVSFFYPQNQILMYQFFSMKFLSELVLNIILTPVVFLVLSLFRSFLVSDNGEGVL